MVDKHIIDKTTGETVRVEDARESIANYILPLNPTERKHGVQVVDSVDVAEVDPYLPDEYTAALLSGAQDRAERNPEITHIRPSDVPNLEFSTRRVPEVSWLRWDSPDHGYVAINAHGEVALGCFRDGTAQILSYKEATQLRDDLDKLIRRYETGSLARGAED